jgi:hypothetical protein
MERKSQFSEKQIIQALREVHAGAKPSDVCRRLGVTEATLGRWRRERWPRNPAGCKPARVDRLARAHEGPKRTDFGPLQAISPDPSGTLNFAGLSANRRNDFGCRSVSNPAGVAIS